MTKHEAEVEVEGLLAIVPPSETEIDALFIEGADLTPIAEKIRELAAELPKDMSVRKNREEVASFAYKVARAKTQVVKAGQEVARKYKELPKKIDANRRIFKEELEALQEEVRSPLNRWEEAEKAREAAVKAALEFFAEQSTATTEESLAGLKERLAAVESTNIDSSFGKEAGKAIEAKEKAVAALQALIEQRKEIDAAEAKAKAEAEAKAEQERIEREARLIKEAEERAKAEQKAALEAAERAKAEAEANAKAAEERAKQAAEQQRLAVERAAEEARAKAEAEAKAKAETEAKAEAERAANLEHQAKINRAIASSLTDLGLNDDEARAITVALVKGFIPHTKVIY